MVCIKIQSHLVLDFATNILKYFGVFSPDWTKGSRFLQLLYYCYSFIVVMFLLGTYVFIQSINLIYIWGDIDLMMATSFLLVTNSAQIFKIIYTLYNQPEIADLIKLTKDMIKDTSLRDRAGIIKRQEWTVLRDIIIFNVGVLVTTTTLAVMPIFRLRSLGKRTLPVEAWYPYDKLKTPMYEISYAHQYLAIITAGNLNGITDIIYPALICQACSQMELLSDTLRNLNMKSNTIPTEQEQKDMYNELKMCVQHHQAIYSLCDRIQHLVSPIAFLQFGVSLATICASLYQIGVNTPGPAELVAMLLYLMCMVEQVYFYCWRGNELQILSSEVCDASYEGEWYKCSEEFKHLIKILQIRARQPVQLRAGSFCNLSLETFKGILKASYSYFTVLSKMKE